MSKHLKDVHGPTRLHYEFHKSGSLEQAFSDTVDIDISPASDGSMKAAARFFSGQRRISYPDVEHAEGNPVLLFYLEREIREMARLTGGQANHFRKMIRTALAESAQIKDTEIHFEGRALQAQQITIWPYLSDQYRDRYPRLVDKQYIFTICEAIPGAMYEIRGVAQPAEGSPKGQAVIDETLTFASAATPQ